MTVWQVGPDVQGTTCELLRVAVVGVPIASPDVTQMHRMLNVFVSCLQPA
jgi:hypothetical protein